jgi:aminoglycoside N3'-acetyltransferase
VPRITTDLRRLGVASGDLLMVHASLRAIGPVVGGADGLLDALAAAVGPDGTLLMTLGAGNDWGWVNEHPEYRRRELLLDAVPFDCLVTPAAPDVGVLAEVFRTRAGTVVSDHPEGRFGASGRRAKALLANVPWNHYYGPRSPLERFLRARGRVLRLGADVDTVTVLHYAEYLTPVRPKRRVRRHSVVKTRRGRRYRVVEGLDDEFGIVDYPGEDYFGQILCQYLATEPASVGLVGGATSELIDARRLVAFGSDWMAEHFTA